MGKILMSLGFAVSAINYLVTAGYFFTNEKVLLGVILLLIPPSEVVLPWVASTILGVVSVVGIFLIIAGSVLSNED